MRYLLLSLLVLSTLVPVPGAALAQADDADGTSRGWIIERPTARHPARAHRSTPRANAAPDGGGAAATSQARRRPSAQDGPMALGYTLYKLDADGHAVSVTPETRFAVGDRVRLRVEPNAQGYIYVFDTEHDRTPVLIFPDAQLDGGTNFIDAHAALDIPSATRSFIIRGETDVDRLYVVLTREPLVGVPTEDALVRYCQDVAPACQWRPTEAQWSAVWRWASAPVHVTTTQAERYAQRGADAESGNRSLVLSAEDPPPAVISKNASRQAGVVVAKVDLERQ
jgi:hypothetical protein